MRVLSSKVLRYRPMSTSLEGSSWSRSPPLGIPSGVNLRIQIVLGGCLEHEWP